MTDATHAIAKLPADASAVSVARDAVYVGCRDGRVFRVARDGSGTTTLRATCGGGNVVADGADVFVLDVRRRTILHERDGAVATLADDVRLSGVGALDATHLFFTTPELLCRIPRGGGKIQDLVRTTEPEVLGVFERSLVFAAGGFFARRAQVGVLPLDGTPPRPIAVRDVAPGCARVCGRALVTLDGSHVLRARDLATDEETELARMADWPEYAGRARTRPFLKADARYVYFDDDARVARRPLAGGPVETRPAGRIVHDAWADGGAEGHFWLVETEGGTELHGWS